jgi:hypothetical protein
MNVLKLGSQPALKHTPGFEPGLIGRYQLEARSVNHPAKWSWNQALNLQRALRQGTEKNRPGETAETQQATKTESQRTAFQQLFQTHLNFC